MIGDKADENRILHILGGKGGVRGCGCCHQLHHRHRDEYQHHALRHADYRAEAAVHLIREGSTIYIGAGTTGHALASKLGCFHHLTVLTNDIDVAHEISYTDNVLIMTGGQLKPHSQTLYGFFAELTLRDLNVDTAFMIVDAVDLDNGFMDYNVDEVSLKRLVIQNAKQCIMLCDAAKFQISALVNVCRLNDVQTVVTNAEADPVYLQRLQNAGIKVVCADKKANEGESL